MFLTDTGRYIVKGRCSVKDQWSRRGGGGGGGNDGRSGRERGGGVSRWEGPDPDFSH